MYIDLSGSVFGRLTVIERNGQSKNLSALWRCKCECGKESNVTTSSLKGGTSKSCGCLKIELQTKHGFAGNNKRTPEYRSWYSMIQRCTNPNNDYYKNYGGRGITIIKEWRDSFICFLESVGNKPTNLHTLDRIDVNKNYEPFNCKWSSRTEQNRNKRIINKNGVSGVYYDKRRNKYKAVIGLNGKEILLGRFDTAGEAILKRKEAEIKYWDKESS